MIRHREETGTFEPIDSPVLIPSFGFFLYFRGRKKKVRKEEGVYRPRQ